MDNKLIQVAIAITVGIVVLGSLLVPVITEASTTEKTFVNEGVFYYGIFDSEDAYTLSTDVSTGKITINGTEIDAVIPNTTTAAYSILSSENVLVRYGHNNNGYYVQCIGIDSNNAGVSSGFVSAILSDGTLAITIENSGGVQSTRTFEFTEIYAIVPTMDEAILKQSTSDIYIKGNSPLYASGLTAITNWNNMFHFEGTYDDGITISSPMIPTATYDNITWNIEPVEGYVDLYKLTSIEFDINYEDTTTHAIYSYFGVPAKVTAEKSQHLDTSEIGLLAVIPVLMIVAFLVFAVRIFGGNRD